MQQQHTMINIYKSQIGDLADQFLQAVEVRDRRYRLRILKSSFVGEEAVTAMIKAGLVTTRSEAVAIGHRLQKELQLFSQPNGRPFKDDKLIYTVNYGNMTLGSWNHVDKDLLKENAYMFLQLVKLEDRFHFLKRYKDCFVGTDVVTSMVYSGLVKSRFEAVQLGRVLETKMELFHGKHEFSDESHFYQLTPKGQKMMKKSLKKAKKLKKKSGPESDFQRDAIQHRIARQLETDYSNRFLANVGEVNREMQERTKTMYTGHHEIVTGDDEARKPTKKSRKKHAKKNKSVEMEMAVPTTVTMQRQRSSWPSTYSLMPSIREGDVMKEESFMQNLRSDEFSNLDEYSIDDEDVYRYSIVDDRKPRFSLADSDDVYIQDNARLSGMKDNVSKNDTSEWIEEIVEEEVTESTDEDSFESLYVEEDDRESSQGSVRDMVHRGLWSGDIDVIQMALKELLERCNPEHGMVSAYRVLELGGIMAILHVIETHRKEHPSFAFLGCALLGRLYQATTLIDNDADDCVYDSCWFKNALFDMESMPLLLAIMKQERNRSVQAYQASRWLVNILYEDTSSY